MEFQYVFYDKCIACGCRYDIMSIHKEDVSKVKGSLVKRNYTNYSFPEQTKNEHILTVFDQYHM